MVYEPTPGNKWAYGDKMEDWHVLLGPCPACGDRTFNYGGGWRCLASYCWNSAGNPVGNLGPAPAWWSEGIKVSKDGDSWCATYSDFINLQVSEAGFGDTPQAAVTALKAINQTSTI